MPRLPLFKHPILHFKNKWLHHKCKYAQVPKGTVLDWKPANNKAQEVNKKGEAELLKGPIRLHGDYSRIRYANIWIKEKK